MKNFLETREALCLGADVPAHVHPQTFGVFSPGAAALAPGGPKTKAEHQNHSGSLPDHNKRHQAEVNVDSVLREVDETNEKRKHRLLRRQRRRQRRRRRGEEGHFSSRRPHRRSDGGAGGIDDDDDLHSDEHPLEELDDGTEEGLGDDYNDGRWPFQSSGGKLTAGSLFESRKERVDVKTSVSLPRLALAASVSTLSGVLANGIKDGGACGRYAPASL